METHLKRSPGFSLVELLVVIAILGVLIGLVLPSVQAAREAARRMYCQNQLRQVGTAILHFESAQHVFPASGWTQVGPGNPDGKYVGWRTMILPYLEQTHVRSLYQPSLHWWEGTNLAVASIPIPTFTCPSVPTQPPILTAIAKTPRPSLSFMTPLGRADYEAIQGVQPGSIDPSRYDAQNRFSVMHRNSSNRFQSISDGASNTIMVVEAAARPSVYRGGRYHAGLFNDQGIGWVDSEGAFSFDGASSDGMREGCRPILGCSTAINAKNDNEPYSFHIGLAHVLFADGHCQSLSQEIDLMVMAALCTKSAGEIVDVTSP